MGIGGCDLDGDGLWYCCVVTIDVMHVGQFETKAWGGHGQRKIHVEGAGLVGGTFLWCQDGYRWWWGGCRLD